jgi:hypothetical protein
MNGTMKGTGNSKAGCADLERPVTARALHRKPLGKMGTKPPPHYGVDKDPWRERQNAKPKVFTRRKGKEFSEYD